MTALDLVTAGDLCRFIDASPSPFHVVESVADRLAAAGFSRASEQTSLPGAGAHYLQRGGSLVAWRARAKFRSFRIIGAHTDSPNLRLKPRPDVLRSGFRQLGVEIYGGVLLNSWLDRDLGLSGRVAVRSPSGVDLRLFLLDRPVLRVPQLAIHLDRDVNDKGLVLNRQMHLSPFWASEDIDDASVREVVAAELGVAAEDILSWELMVHPIDPARLSGLREEFVSAPRLDNQLSCWAGTHALIGAAAGESSAQVLVLFDHEEVGSASGQGADGAYLGSVLERLAVACGVDREGYLTALANSFCVSADNAHATNPNYADRHEPNHTIALNAGPVLKINSNLRYATDAATAATFVSICAGVDVPLQHFVTRTDLACGSTIGPLTAAALGIQTVDIGAPQLAMHSARELCGAADPPLLAKALTAFLGH